MQQHFGALKQVARGVLPEPVWTRLRLLRLRRSVTGYSPRQVRHVYGGHELQVLLKDPMAAGWYDQDWPLPSEIELMRRGQLRKGATIFDVGAHQGVVAMMLAREAGQTGRVVAVEASGHNAAMLRANRDLNAIGNLWVEHAAISDSPGVLTFNEGLNGQVDDGSGSWGRVEVRATTIDALTEVYGPPDVLFIDVEGFECHALRGARDTLLRRPDCFIEVHVNHGLETFGGSLEEVTAPFREGFTLYMHSDAEPAPQPFDPDAALTRDRFFLTALAS
jgi:FkbM family methyltransferase